MTNKFQIGDLVRVPTIDFKRNSDGSVVEKWDGRTRKYVSVYTKVWSDFTNEVVAVPNAKRKRYQVKAPSGFLFSYTEKSLARA
jgi:hypothetical protein